MVRWLLNHLSTLGFFGLIVGGTTVLAMAGAFSARKALPNLGKGQYDDVKDSARSLAILVYAFVLAFSLFDVFAKQGAASEAAKSEAMIATQLVRASRSFLPDERISIEEAIGQYVRAVSDDEWLAMKEGRSSSRADEAIDNLYATYQNYQQSDGVSASLAGASLAKLDQLSATRQERLDKATTQLLPHWKFSILVSGLAVIILSYPAKISSLRVQMLGTGAIAALLSFGFALTLALDYPFAGDQTVDNRSFKSGALAQF